MRLIFCFLILAFTFATFNGIAANPSREEIKIEKIKAIMADETIATNEAKIKAVDDILKDKDILLWLVVGFAGQILFGSRMILQWIASEKNKKSVIPASFWYLSIFGSTLLLAYAIYRRDPVFIVSQSTGFIIYIRNIYFQKNSKNPA